tara:strand:- start:77869 stop:78186 length:318 start_codon:yes stop_codon:yes gene_type:complete
VCLESGQKADIVLQECSINETPDAGGTLQGEVWVLLQLAPFQIFPGKQCVSGWKYRDKPIAKPRCEIQVIGLPGIKGHPELNPAAVSQSEWCAAAICRQSPARDS